MGYTVENRKKEGITRNLPLSGWLKTSIFIFVINIFWDRREYFKCWQNGVHRCFGYWFPCCMSVCEWRSVVVTPITADFPHWSWHCLHHCVTYWGLLYDSVLLGRVGNVTCMTFKIAVLGRAAYEQKLSEFEEWLAFFTVVQVGLTSFCVFWQLPMHEP